MPKAIKRPDGWPGTHLADVSAVPQRDLPFDDPWRDRVRRRLDELGVFQQDLANWVGSVQSQISYVLNNRDVKRSIYVERISVALRIAMPDTARVEVAVAKLLEDGREDRLRLLVANAEAFTSD